MIQRAEAFSETNLEGVTAKPDLSRVSLAPLTAGVIARTADCITTHIGLNHFGTKEIGTTKYFMHFVDSVDLGMILHETMIYGPAFAFLYALQRTKPKLGEKGFALSTLFSTCLMANNIAVMMGYDIPGLNEQIKDLEYAVCDVLRCTPLPPYTIR